VLAQRLVRRLCGDCRQPLPAEQGRAAAASLGVAPPAEATLYKAVGCASCRNTGYRGRVAIHELLRLTDEVKQQVLERGTAVNSVQSAYVGGNLLQDGATKVFSGLTTAEEVLRVARQHD